MIKEIRLLSGKANKRSLIKKNKQKEHVIGEIAKTREETIAMSGKIKEVKDQFAVFNCVTGLRLRREPLLQHG